ncbi:MAG: Uma2 family endonuclease [Haliscomenobacter sp.]|nr:Uma2 family endonuclease [Haliscomenobacter sp.]MBK9491054.1 Uma2 family endonuclease [Haliscomenobacter sp.]
MSPIGPSHTAHVKGINRVLSKLLDGLAIVGVQDPIVLDDLSEPVPDISILKWRDDDYLQAQPTPENVLLVIEVADSSVGIDWEAKRPAYAAAGIPEYWSEHSREKN